MRKPPLKVIEGGRQCIPAFFVSLERLHTDLVQAYTPLQEKVDVLEADWDTRPVSFWQEILTALPVLREAVQPCIEYTLGNRETFPCGFPRSFLCIRYSLLSALYSAERFIDDTGIAITSYKPVCQSREVVHLQQRQQVLKTLRKLVEHVREAARLMESQIKQKTTERNSHV
jgi:hypothetical protein